MAGKIHAGLARRINAAHRSAVEAAQSALLHAKEAGELLLEAKAACAHGEWGGWLQENVEFSDRTARGYMRVASRWHELENRQRVADLSLRGALAMLAAPKDAEFEDSWAPDPAPAYLPERGSMAMASVPGPAGTTLHAWIVPSAEHPGYPLCAPEEAAYYITVGVDLPDGGSHVEGEPKPWRTGFVARLLSAMRFPSEATWRSVESEPWTYNELLFNSHEDYVERHVLCREAEPMLAHLRETGGF